MTHKYKRIPRNDNEDGKKRNNLISINGNESKESIVDEWLIEQFKNKLKKVATIVGNLNKPLALYCGIIEESEDSAKEEIVTP